MDALRWITNLTFFGESVLLLLVSDSDVPWELPFDPLALSLYPFIN